MNRARLIPSVLLLAWIVSAVAQTGNRTTTDANHIEPMALKGKLLFADDFTTPAEYTKQLQPVAEGWRVLRSSRDAFMAMVYLTIAGTLAKSLAVLAPHYTRDVLRIDAENTVFVVAPAAIGVAVEVPPSTE